MSGNPRASFGRRMLGLAPSATPGRVNASAMVEADAKRERTRVFEVAVFGRELDESERPGSFSNTGPFEPVTLEALRRAHDTMMKHLESRVLTGWEAEPVPPWVADLLSEEEET